MAPKEHEIVELEAMSVLGVFGSINCVDDLWEPGFISRQKEIQKIAVIKGKYYGISFDDGQRYYLAGMVVKPPSEISEGLVLRKIPAGKYAKLEGPFHEWWIKEGPGWVYDTWLPESQYELNQTTSMRDFVIHGVKNWVEFYVPVREKAQASLPNNNLPES